MVALVPARNEARTIADTVGALMGLALVEKVVVADDASDDDTAALAREAGAEVVVLAENRGKAGAVAAAIERSPEAEAYLLVDGDLGSSAAGMVNLLPRLAGAELIVAVPPDAAGRGGFGLVRDFAAEICHRAGGPLMSAPLSGQRAVSGPLLRSLELAPRFGLEVGMTLDALALGVTPVEVPVAFDHEHRGRTLGGFAHRARQGADVVAAAVPRLGVWAVVTAALAASIRRFRR